VRHALRIDAFDRFLVTSRSAHIAAVLRLLLLTTAPACVLLRFTRRPLALLTMLRSRLSGLALLALPALSLLPVVESFHRRWRCITALLPHKLLFDLGQLLAWRRSLRLSLLLLALLALSLLLATLALAAPISRFFTRLLGGVRLLLAMMLQLLVANCLVL
jgi:hypothetical protein